MYLAEDITLERKVAVKLLTHQCCEDSSRLQRFTQEFNTAYVINHQNIQTIFEFGKLKNFGQLMLLKRCSK